MILFLDRDSHTFDDVNPVVGSLYLATMYYNLFNIQDYICDTLEPPARCAHPRIPDGNYSFVMRRSPKFGRVLPRLVDVPLRSGILIHAGNTVKDTLGCILVGTAHKTIPYNLVDSRKALSKVIQLIDSYGIRNIVVSTSLPF